MAVADLIRLKCLLEYLTCLRMAFVSFIKSPYLVALVCGTLVDVQMSHVNVKREKTKKPAVWKLETRCEFRIFNTAQFY